MVHMTCVNKSPTIPECDDSDLEARVEALEECCEEVHTELDNKADADEINTELESIRAELNTLIAGWHYVGEVEDEESLPTTLTEGEVYYSLEDNGFYVAVSDDPNNGWRFISGVKSAITPIHLEDGVISHDDSGVTAGTYGDTANQTPDFGETFKAVSATVDSKGHVTSISEHTVELPDPYDIYDTKCGDIVTIDDAEEARVKSLTVSLSPLQAGTGTPSPDNIRPITGHDTLNTHVTGVNQWDEEWEVGGISSVTGGNITNNDVFRSKNYIPIVNGASYYFRCGTADTIGLRFYDSGKYLIGDLAVNANQIISTYFPAGTRYIRFVDASRNTYNNDISINYPSTDHDYHAYTGTTYETDLEQTVYGGNADVVNGTGQSTMGYVDLGTLTWTYRSDLGAGIFATTDITDYKAVMTPITALSSSYMYRNNTASGAVVSQWNSGEFGFYAQPDNPTRMLYIKDTNYSDAVTFKAAMSGVQLVYETAEPQTLTFTPQTVSLNSGTNNVWSDGYTCVEYMKDKGELTDTLAELQDCCQGALIVNLTNDIAYPPVPGSIFMEASYKTIHDAYASGRPVYFKDPSGNMFSAVFIGTYNNYLQINIPVYGCDSMGCDFHIFDFVANTENDEPVFSVAQ